MCSHVLIAFNEGEHLNAVAMVVDGDQMRGRRNWEDDDDGAT